MRSVRYRINGDKEPAMPDITGFRQDEASAKTKINTFFTNRNCFR